MKFSRKLIVRSGTYGTISVPKPVLDAWASVGEVMMDFDETSNTLAIVPKQEDFRTEGDHNGEQGRNL